MTTRCPNCGTKLTLTMPPGDPEPVDLGVLLEVTRALTARSAAAAIFCTESPTPAQLERARRRLEEMVQWGAAVKARTARTGGRYSGVVYHPPGHVPSTV